MYQFSCGRPYRGFRNWTAYRGRRMLRLFYDVLPIHRGNGHFRGQTMRDFCRNENTHDRKYYGRIHIFRRNDSMLGGLLLKKKPFARLPFSSGY